MALSLRGGQVINWTIDLGSVVQIIGFIGTVIYVTATVRGDVGSVKEDISDIKIELRSLHQVISTQASEKVRLDLIARRLDKMEDDIRELRHGEGFIFPLGGKPR